MEIIVYCTIFSAMRINNLLLSLIGILLLTVNLSYCEEDGNEENVEDEIEDSKSGEDDDSSESEESLSETQVAVSLEDSESFLSSRDFRVRFKVKVYF